MNLRVYELSQEGVYTCVGVVDDYNSFNFTLKFLECGTWQLRGIYTPQTAELLQPGRMLFATEQIAGIIESFVIETTEKGNQFYTAYGRELKSILDYRIIRTTYDRNVAVNEYIKGIFDQNIAAKGARYLPVQYKEIKNKAELTYPLYKRQISYKSVLESFSSVCGDVSTPEFPLGFDVRAEVNKDNQLNLVFNLIVGEDRLNDTLDPLVFAPQFDNIKNYTSTKSIRDMYNYVVVGGQKWNEEDKEVVQVETFTGREPKGFNRREMYADVSSQQSPFLDEKKEHKMSYTNYQNVLRQAGKDKLVPARYTITGAVEQSLQAPTNLLGAVVGVSDMQALTKDYITEINIIEEKDGIQTTFTIGKDIQAKLIGGKN